SLMVNDPAIPSDDQVTQRLVLNIKQEYGNRIYEIIVIDNENTIQGNLRSNDDYSKWLDKYEPPGKIERIQEKIFESTILGAAENHGVGEVDVYDYVSALINKETREKKGELHIRRLKSYIDDAIAEKRWEDARVALLILISSYAGTIILIYVLLNPFKKLGDWIRALDHGDEVEDEMDIDSSTEIGEIAKAFSEITTKFRESQKNLVQQEQLQKEMQVAQEIQQTLLPTDFPDLEGYEISSLYQAAKEVGGDYYDFVEVDKDTLGIVVADVSGKGVPGSLVMTMIRTALRTEARGVKDAAEVLARVNDFVVNDMKKGMFVTIFYVIIDSKRRRLNYASAGHNPMILYRPSANKTYYLNPKGFPIGIQLAETDLFRNSIASDTIQLAEDDILILYTDGITEAMNGNRDLYGEERFLDVIREHGRLRVKPFVEKLQLEIESFTEGAVQYDDITLVSIKEKTSPEKEELRRAKLAHIAIVDGNNIRDACEKAGITTYAYYNKYKKQFEEHGIENYEVDEDVSVEAKHVSVEDKTKIFDIIRNHPEYGAKRIAEELNTEKYGLTVISENKIYEELVRSRLNTRQLREAFIARGDRSRRRMKQPGTPMLTLDGRVIIDRETPAKSQKDKLPVKPAQAKEKKEKPGIPQKPPIEIKKWIDTHDTDVDMEVISTPIEDLLDKSREASDEVVADFLGDDVKSNKIILDEADSEQEKPVLDADDIHELIKTDDVSQDFGFDELVEDEGKNEDNYSKSGTEPFDHEHESENESDLAAATLKGNSDESNEDFTFAAFEDLLKMEISSSFEDEASNIVIDESEKAMESEPELQDNQDDRFEKDGVIPGQEDDELVESADEPDKEKSLPPAETFEVNSDSDSAKLPVLGDDTIEILTGVGADKSNINGDSHSLSEKESSGDDPYDFKPLRPQVLQSVNRQKPLNTGDGAIKRRAPILTHFDEMPGLQKKEEIVREQSDVKTHDVPEMDKKQVDVQNTEKDNGAEREKLLVAGLRYYKKHEFDQAIAQFEQAVELFPDFKEAHSVLGNAYFRKDLFEQASKAYNRVLELDPADATAHENMGVIYANQGQLDKAIERWENVIRIDPDRADIKKKIQKALELLDEKQFASK
ncbi:MAG: SpoIIE family protein phosphatase, partial [bacterium]